MTPRPASTRRAAVLLLGAGAAVLLLAGCATAPAASSIHGPGATPPAPAAACPSAEQLAALTASPFTADSSSSAPDRCVYVAGSGGDASRVVLRRDRGGARTTLTHVRRRAALDGASTSDARTFSFDAFTARSGSTCTAWVHSTDGRLASVEATRPDASAAARCTLATAAAALLPRPAAGAIRTPIVSVVAPVEELGAERVRRVADALGDRAGARVDLVDASAARDGAAAAREAGLAAVRRVQPRSEAVVILSGTAEAGRSRLQVLRSATAMLALASRTAPDARVLLVGPTLDDGAGTGDVRALRDSLAVAARIDRAEFVDPIASGWTPASSAAARRAADDDLVRTAAARID